jgi:hypothetical protein
LPTRLRNGGNVPASPSPRREPSEFGYASGVSFSIAPHKEVSHKEVSHKDTKSTKSILHRHSVFAQLYRIPACLNF